MESQSDRSKVNVLRSIPDHPVASSSNVTAYRHPLQENPPRLAKELEGAASGIFTGASPSSSTANLLTSFGQSTSVDPISTPDTTLASGSDLHPIGLHFREGSGNARKLKSAVRANVPEDSEERLLSAHSYPPSQRATFSEQAANLRYHDSHDHAPISAPTVFSPHAAPLSLPRLDKYISSLPLPAFSSPSRSNTNTKKHKFVPLDRLTATGRSIESLETNYKAKPIWRNCRSILSGLVSGVVGVLVSGTPFGCFFSTDVS